MFSIFHQLSTPDGVAYMKSKRVEFEMMDVNAAGQTRTDSINFHVFFLPILLFWDHILQSNT